MIYQFIINGLIVGSLYSLVALGFSLIYHNTRIFHIAHGGLYVASAYFFYLLYNLLAVPIELSIMLALIIVISMGIGIYKVVYQPHLKKRTNPLIPFISSLGVYIILINLIALLFGNETKILNPNIEQTYIIGEIILTRIQIIQFISSFLIVGLVLLFLKYHKIGYIIRGVADNDRLSSILGINANHIRSIVLGLGSGLAGIAAILMSVDTSIDPYIGMEMFLVAAVATIIGGVGSYEGSVIGAVFLGVAQNLVVWQTSARWQLAITFVILIIILLWRPQGLLSKKIRVEEV